MHRPRTAELHAYDFDSDALKFIYSYLKGRKQRTEINSSYSSFAGILFGVPQEILFGVAQGILFGVAQGILFGLAQGILFGVAQEILFGVAQDILFGVAQDILFGVAQGILFGVAQDILFGVAQEILFGVAQDILFGVPQGILFGVPQEILFGVPQGILFGVPQGSILGPLLFDASICDLFYGIDDLDFASFADDNTPYSCLSDMISVLGQLKGGIIKIFDWFKKIFLKGNADKCH